MVFTVKCWHPGFFFLGEQIPLLSGVGRLVLHFSLAGKLPWGGFSQNLGFQEISARALWCHHNFYTMTSHAEHSWGWWRKSSRSSEDFQVLPWTGLGSHHNLLVFLEVPHPSQIHGMSNLSLGVPASSLSISTCLFIEAHGGAHEALLLSEGPDPCSCWGLLMWLRLTHGCVAGSSL